MTPFEIAARLKRAGIYFTIHSHSEGVLMFEAAVPGERWEWEVFADGSHQLERFRSDGKILDEPSAIDALIEKFSN